jgi:hypothetical protein
MVKAHGRDIIEANLGKGEVLPPSPLKIGLTRDLFPPRGAVTSLNAA